MYNWSYRVPTQGMLFKDELYINYKGKVSTLHLKILFVVSVPIKDRPYKILSFKVFFSSVWLCQQLHLLLLPNVSVYFYFINKLV